MTQITSAPETPDADFHARVKSARLEAGYTLESAYMALHRRYPNFAPKMSTLSRLEHKTLEERADNLVLLMLARLYGVELGELSPMRASADTKCLSDLLASDSRWITACAGQQRFPLAS